MVRMVGSGDLLWRCRSCSGVQTARKRGFKRIHASQWIGFFQTITIEEEEEEVKFS
jgi:hypothetical protein